MHLKMQAIVCCLLHDVGMARLIFSSNS